MILQVAKRIADIRLTQAVLVYGSANAKFGRIHIFA